MTAPRIALVHATPVAIEPIQSAFAALWPAARISSLLDDSLSADLAAAGRLDRRMIERFITLGRYCKDSGADAILFTCSAFGAAIDAVKSALNIPVLKPNEAMMDEALESGSRIGLLVTFEPSIASMRAELEQAAAWRGLTVAIEARTASGALAALQSGNGAEHDRLIASHATEFDRCDVLMLAQFSMARAATEVSAATRRKVLTSPQSAVNRLKQMLSA